MEFALIAPWFVFLFVGAFDFGMASYALISVEGAARAGAMWASASVANAQTPGNIPCTYALAALQYTPSGNGATTCSATGPVNVTTTYNAVGADGNPSVTVTVTYKLSLIPFLGVAPASMPVSRTVEFSIRS
jgi:Flp pilus assembly protein TadG